jgi:enamine deaminase RidA (YjgF/YER057c/UK114 family)
MSIQSKLAELGLTLPVAAAPVAAYVPAVRTGNLVFTAGQLPLVDGKIPFIGKVGSDVTPEQAKDMAQICALNALAAISLVADIDQIERVVRVGGFVNGIPGFVAIPQVINGASELLIKLFGEVNGKHARTAIGVAELPLNAPVEVEMVVQIANSANNQRNYFS